MGSPLPPAPLDLSGPPVLLPFYGCIGIEWNEETKVLYLLSEPTTPMVCPHDPLIGRFVADYNNPTSDELVKKHVLYVLLAEITYTRTDLHAIILNILTSGNLPTRIQEKGYYE